MSAPRDWDERADELSAQAIGRGEPTAWFDELYAAGAAGAGRRAVVVGCGPRQTR